MAFALPELPYAKDAFGDILSAETFDYHYGKHHQAYITQANDQTKGTDLEDASLLTVIAKAKETGNKKLFNASAQIWNHSFYWLGLSPERPSLPRPCWPRSTRIWAVWTPSRPPSRPRAPAISPAAGAGWCWKTAS
jgi:superoxide dismutase